MDNLNLTNNSIIITNASDKGDIVKSLSNTLSYHKVFTIEEVLDKYYFTYNDKAIYYLITKYNYKYDIARMYLSYLRYVDKSDYNDKKIRRIIDIREELDSNNLLIYNYYFREYLKDKEIIFYNITNNILFKKLYNELKNNYNVKVINKNYKEYKHKYIYEFNTIDDEVVYVASSICELILNGVSPNNIYLCNVTGEYLSLVKKIFKWFNLNISLNDNYLYSTKMGKDFINNISKSMDDSIKYIKDNCKLVLKEELDIYYQLISILNKYAWCDDLTKVKEFIINDLKNTKIMEDELSSSIKVISNLRNVSDNDYVFLLGFNQGSVPSITKDEGYFSDEIMSMFNLDTTSIINKEEADRWLLEINSVKNLIITYKKHSPNGEFYISSLNDVLGLDITIKKNTYKYSNLYNKLMLGEYLDTLIKYNEKVEDIDHLYSIYNDIDYRTYNNSYSNINKNTFYKYLDNNLTLSYSAINSYYQCGFRYYLSNILKLNIYEETFYTVLGNLFHYILSIVFVKEIDFHKEYWKFIESSNYPFSKKETFFLKNLEPELEFIISTIKEQSKVSKLKNVYVEEKITNKFTKDNINICFKGFVDKMLTNDDNTSVAIIDYKTGNPSLNLNHTIYGLDLQLPVYIYLAKKKFPHARIVGFYLQKILNNEINKDYKHTYLELKQDNLKLQGYSNADISLLEEFDNTYQNSTVIKGMKTSSKGLFTKKILDDEKIDLLSDITLDKIEEATNNIVDVNFNINPKRIGNNNLGCKYCDFKDICFMKEKDIVNLKEYKNLEFLNGDV